MAVRNPDVVVTTGTPFGTAGTSGVGSNQRKYDIGERIFDLEPNKAPLVLLTSKLGKENATDPDFKHFEDERLPRWTALTAISLAADTTLEVTAGTGKYFRAGDIILNSTTGEVCRVASVAVDVVTVTRGWGSTAAADMAVGERIQILASSLAEGSGARPLLSTQPGLVTNYCQIFKTPYGVTNTLKSTQLWTVNQFTEEQRKAAIEHAIDIERAFLFAEPKIDVSGTYPIRTTGGLRYWLQTNVQSVGGALTWDAFNQFMRTIFRYGGQTRLLLCSPLLLGAIQRVASGNIRIAPADKTYGLNIGEWISPWGRVMLMNHWLIEDYYNTNGWGFAIDPSQLKYKVLRNTFLQTNIQANDADLVEDQYLTEAGLKVIQEKAMGIIKNVTS